MNDIKPARASWHEQRPVALTGLAVFVASFAAFQYLVAALPLVAALAAASMAAFAMALATAAAAWRVRRCNALMSISLNTMTQGLCMFDKNERLVICNQRYIELYRLSPEIA